MKSRIDKLLSVKSIVTLVLTAAFVGMIFKAPDIQPELLALFSTVYGSVMTFYFTRKEDKDENTTAG